MNTTTQFMTEDQLKEFPILFQEENTRSRKYSHIKTIDQVNKIIEMDWKPVAVKQQNSKKFKGFQPHIVLFENEKISSLFKKEGVSPQILLVNSYNGLKSFNVHFGLFRLVCSNGLVVGESVLEQVKMLHKGLNEEHTDLNKTIEFYVNQIPVVMEKVDAMKSTQLTHIDKLDIAGKAIELRYLNSEHYPFNSEELLITRRPEDEGNDLWRTYNKIQENLVKGGQLLEFKPEEGKRRKTSTRPLKDINRDLLLNKALFDMAVRYCKK